MIAMCNKKIKVHNYLYILLTQIHIPKKTYMIFIKYVLHNVRLYDISRNSKGKNSNKYKKLRKISNLKMN